MAVERFYDDIADRYDELRYGSEYQQITTRYELDFIEQFLGRGNCLEVGAGTGRVTRFLVDRSGSVTAVDQSARMLEKLRQKIGARSNLETQVTSIYELDRVRGYGTFENVVCIRVLPHLEEPDRALELLRDAVVAGGMVIFDLWNSWGYDAILKRVGIRKRAVYTDYISIKQMRAMIELSQMRVVARRALGFPPLKLFSFLETSACPGLDFVAQRVLWVCQTR